MKMNQEQLSGLGKFVNLYAEINRFGNLIDGLPNA